MDSQLDDESRDAFASLMGFIAVECRSRVASGDVRVAKNRQWRALSMAARKSPSSAGTPCAKLHHFSGVSATHAARSPSEGVELVTISFVFYKTSVIMVDKAPNEGPDQKSPVSLAFHLKAKDPMKERIQRERCLQGGQCRQALKLSKTSGIGMLGSWCSIRRVNVSNMLAKNFEEQ